MADSDSTSPDKKRQEPPPIEFLKPGQEQPAPPPEQRPPAAWVTRPEDYQRPQYAQGPAPPRAGPRGAGKNARIAGLLLILAAALSAGWLLFNSLTPLSVSDYANFSKDTGAYALNQVCSMFVVWGQAIMALAGIMAYQRLNWRMTVSCALVSLMLLGGFAVLVLAAVLDPLVIAAAILGLVGFVLTVTAKDEFVS